MADVLRAWLTNKDTDLRNGRAASPIVVVTIGDWIPWSNCTSHCRSVDHALGAVEAHARLDNGPQPLPYAI
jgi:hypothetical protein